MDNLENYITKITPILNQVIIDVETECNEYIAQCQFLEKIINYNLNYFSAFVPINSDYWAVLEEIFVARIKYIVEKKVKTPLGIIYQIENHCFKQNRLFFDFTNLMPKEEIGKAVYTLEKEEIEGDILQIIRKLKINLAFLLKETLDSTDNLTICFKLIYNELMQTNDVCNLMRKIHHKKSTEFNFCKKFIRELQMILISIIESINLVDAEE